MVGPAFVPVGKLTVSRAGCRQSGGGRRAAARVLASLILLGSWAAAGAETPPVQPPESITAAAVAYLEERAAAGDRRLSFRAQRLDPRLKLPRCDRPLEAWLHGDRAGARAVVGVRCSGAREWKVYVPVDAVELRQVLVAKRALPRGHVLAADDLTVEQRDVSRLAAGYLSRPEDAAGRKLARQLVSGSVLAPGALETEVLIRRGQSVTLLVTDGPLNVRTAGKALMDGALDERIRVTNLASRRTVEGLVRSPELVEVLVR